MSRFWGRGYGAMRPDSACMGIDKQKVSDITCGRLLLPLSGEQANVVGIRLSRVRSRSSLFLVVCLHSPQASLLRESVSKRTHSKEYAF